ncbi:hypothetical protein AGMMS49944_00410 [Spirochaetia bacterium]|nr:hypothetical protein AGMMS49944_00410 [Spirochaetia bacterium]
MKINAWNRLLEFETRDLIERYVKDKHGRKCSAKQIMEISSNFIQGREYFKNAKQAAITVKPLLQYYGVSALCRGLVLACTPYISEAALKPSHGLETIKWQESLAKRDFGGLTVAIRHGAFYELLSYTENKVYFKHNSSAISYSQCLEVPQIGTEIKLNDLLLTFPDLAGEYKTWSQNKLHYAILQTFNILNGTHEYEYGINKTCGKETIEELFPKILLGDYDLSDSGSSTIIKTKDSYLLLFAQIFTDSFNAGMGEIALTKPINQHVYLSSLAQFYVVSFFLGMLSRYFPSVWISLSRTEKGDSIFPLVVKIIDMIDDYFPELILNYLLGPYSFEKSKTEGGEPCQ